MATHLVGSDAERLRGLRAMWGGVAGAWEEHADYLDARASGLTAAMLDALALSDGDRVLELACGAGGAGLAAAERVGPSGEVVLSDVAPEMTEAAARRAATRRATNVCTRVLALESVEEPDASFDAVLCREGLMFATDPATALREVLRVLRPGGRAAFAVWGPPAENPWMRLPFEAVRRQAGVPVPDPGSVGPFALSDPSRLRELVTEAGLTDVRLEEVPVPMQVASTAEWWSRTSALAGPLVRLIAAMTDRDRAAVRARLDAEAAPYVTADGVTFPGLSLLASGHRP